MKLHIITHESFEAPAAIELWAKRKGHEIGHTRLYQGDDFPEDNKSFDFLVVMGGPQSPATTVKECPHFDATAEIAFIKRAIDDGKSALGVCLGAQMIGESLGAPFEHSPHREIGVFPITLTEAGEQDPFFSRFPHTFSMGHWHGDMPGLTPDAALLAYSEGCPRQIVRYRPNVYGFQCHFEFTPDAIEGMIEACSDELEQYASLPFVKDAQTLRSNDYSEINNRLYAFLDYMESITR